MEVEQRSAMEVNVLFTSVGRRVELLRSFRRAYEVLGVSGRIVAVDIDPLASALRVADRPYLVPRLDSPEYIPALGQILRRERVDLVFPLIDPDVPVLAEHREALESTGARLAVVPRAAAAIAADKWLTNEFFGRLGLDTPRSWLPGEHDPAAGEYPLFIKPRFGSASQQTFRIDNPGQLRFFSEYVPQAILQEYLSGPEITSDVICDLEGSVLTVVSRQRIRVRAGEVIVGKTVFDASIAENCIRVAKALPAVGPITVQCIMRDGVPAFTEINARFGGGVPLGIAAGMNSPLWLVAKAEGLAVEIPPLGSYEQNLYLSRFDESFFVSEADREQMASRRL